MQLLLTNLAWDSEGQTLEECRLPDNVVVLDFNDDGTYLIDEYNDNISDLLLNNFGFHASFTWERLTDSHDTHAGGAFFPKNLALVRWRTY